MGIRLAAQVGIQVISQSGIRLFPSYTLYKNLSEPSAQQWVLDCLNVSIVRMTLVSFFYFYFYSYSLRAKAQ